jgi:hypothetical protein
MSVLVAPVTAATDRFLARNSCREPGTDRTPGVQEGCGDVAARGRLAGAGALILELRRSSGEVPNPVRITGRDRCGNLFLNVPRPVAPDRFLKVQLLGSIAGALFKRLELRVRHSLDIGLLGSVVRLCRDAPCGQLRVFIGPAIRNGVIDRLVRISRILDGLGVGFLFLVNPNLDRVQLDLGLLINSDLDRSQAFGVSLSLLIKLALALSQAGSRGLRGFSNPALPLAQRIGRGLIPCVFDFLRCVSS